MLFLLSQKLAIFNLYKKNVRNQKEKESGKNTETERWTEHFLHAHETERGEEATQKRVRAAEKGRCKKKKARSRNDEAKMRK